MPTLTPPSAVNLAEAKNSAPPSPNQRGLGNRLFDIRKWCAYSWSRMIIDWSGWPFLTSIRGTKATDPPARGT